jgi:hypothetical protein
MTFTLSPGDPPPGLVLVIRAAIPSAVPSRIVKCAWCDHDCWLSKRTGDDTITAARTYAGGVEPVITCAECVPDAVIALREIGAIPGVPFQNLGDLN